MAKHRTKRKQAAYIARPLFGFRVPYRPLTWSLNSDFDGADAGSGSDDDVLVEDADGLREEAADLKVERQELLFSEQHLSVRLSIMVCLVLK
jgi:hypothetical protein